MADDLKFDPIDEHILTILQEDATLSVQDLGDRVGLSANPCWRRVRRLEQAGVIERRVAIVSPAALGLDVTVFVAIKTDKHEPGWLESLSAGIAAISEIVECHRMSGDIDYLLKVTVRDIAHYDRVYQRLIAAVPGLADVSSTFSMERLKYSTALDVRAGRAPAKR